MAGVNGCEREIVHCTIKLLIPGETASQGEVLTIGRSEGMNHRWHGQFGRASRYKVTDNSAYSSILGVKDREVPWQCPLPCFSCNWLSCAGKYVSNRNPSYRPFYDSTVVFPVTKISREAAEDEYWAMAFLTFDTLTKNGFASMPDVYESRAYVGNDELASYLQRLYSCSVFHVGKSMALALGQVLPRLLKKAVE